MYKIVASRPFSKPQDTTCQFTKLLHHSNMKNRIYNDQIQRLISKFEQCQIKRDVWLTRVRSKCRGLNVRRLSTSHSKSKFGVLFCVFPANGPDIWLLREAIIVILMAIVEETNPWPVIWLREITFRSFLKRILKESRQPPTEGFTAFREIHNSAVRKDSEVWNILHWPRRNDAVSWNSKKR